MWFKKKQEKEIDYLQLAKQTIDYISKCKELGKSEEFIKQQLREKEYPEAFIEYIFKRSDNVKTLSPEEEIIKTLDLGKKYLIKTSNIEKAFELMLKRIKMKGGLK